MAATIRHQRHEPLRTASAWLAAANDVAWDSASDDEILEGLVAINVLRNQADALAGRLAVAAERGPVQRDGSRKASIWIGANTNASPTEVRHDIRNAKWLLDYADFRDAFETGVLSRRHVDALRGAETSVTRLSLLRDQEMLVDFADKLSWDDFNKALQYWINAADPDGTIPNHRAANNHITLRRRSDGSGTVDGDLDPLAFTTLHDGIEREMKKLRAQDQDTGTKRSIRELRIAATLALIERGAARSDGSTGNPLIKIVMGEKLAEQLLLADADPDTPITPSFDDPDHRCEFLDGTPLHPRFAKALLGLAEFRRMILTADSRDLDISVNTRSFPQWMRDGRLVETRGRCIEHGCDAKFHWLHMDHRKPRAKGGQTNYRNLDPYCGEGNHAKGDTWTEPPDPDDPDKPAA